MDSFKLHKIDKTQGAMYCGATVLAVLTGYERKKIHADINRFKRADGKRRRKTVYDRRGNYMTTKLIPWPLSSMVAGIPDRFMEKALKKYKLKPENLKKEYPSLRQLVNDMGHFTMPLVVVVTGHYVLFHQGKIYDTHTPDGQDALSHPCAGKRVRKIWKIKATGGQK